MRDFLLDLKKDLAVRPDMKHVGSKLGGNASEYYFLISKNTSFVPCDNDLVSFEDKNDTIILSCNESAKLSDIRSKLTEFYNLHPDKMDLSFERLILLVRELPSEDFVCENIKLMKKCFDLTSRVKESLDKNNEIYDKIFAHFESLRKEIEKKFAESLNMKYPLTKRGSGLAEVDDNRIFHHQLKLPKNSLVKEQLENLTERSHSICKLLLSSFDLQLLKEIQLFPEEIKIIPIRVDIGIESIVKFDLDNLVFLKLWDN